MSSTQNVGRRQPQVAAAAASSVRRQSDYQARQRQQGDYRRRQSFVPEDEAEQLQPTERIAPSAPTRSRRTDWIDRLDEDFDQSPFFQDEQYGNVPAPSPAPRRERIQRTQHLQNSAPHADHSGEDVSDANRESGSGEKKTSKKKRLPLIIGIIVAILVLGGGGFYAWRYYTGGPSTEVDTFYEVPFSVDIDGCDSATATRIPVYITGTTLLDGLDIEETQFLDVNGTGVEMVPGSYTVQVLASPLTQNGIYYAIPTALLNVEVTDAGFASSAGIFTFTKMDAADITDAQIQASYEYALQDPESSGRAEEYRSATVSVRDDAAVVAKASDTKVQDTEDQQSGTSGSGLSGDYLYEGDNAVVLTLDVPKGTWSLSKGNTSIDKGTIASEDVAKSAGVDPADYGWNNFLLQSDSSDDSFLFDVEGYYGTLREFEGEGNDFMGRYMMSGMSADN